MTAAAVVVGAGVTGLSIAYHLARRGVGRVVVLERERIASGATGKSVGGIRQQFSDELNIRLARHSVAVFERFRDEFGVDCDFRQYGYLLLATTPDEQALFERNVRLQRSLGVPVELLGPDEAGRMVPGLRTDDVRIATFCARDGYADPYSVAMGFAGAARRLGVQILEGVEVVGIPVRAGRAGGVVTTTGMIEAEVVVNAAGAWAAQVAALAGVALPIQAYRRQVFVTGPTDALPERLPLVIDFRTHFYFRREGAGVLVGMTDPDEPPGFQTHVDWSFAERVLTQALHRIPPLATAAVLRGWAGLYDTTPDGNPILGPLPQVENFFVAAGFSGHGFMQSPAVGEAIAELIVAGRPSTPDLDVAPFGVARFATGVLRREANVI